MMDERQIIESTYNGRMDVYCFEDVTTSWGETRQEKVLLYSDMPCALSQYHLRPAAHGDSHSQRDYQAKLFAPPDMALPAGCDVEVRQHGMTYLFKYSGDAFIYPSHQEIMVERLEKV